MAEMTYEQLDARMKNLGDEIRRVAGKDEVTAEDSEYLRDMKEEFDGLTVDKEKLERAAILSEVDVVTGRKAIVETGGQSGELDDDPFRGEIDKPGVIRNPWDLSEVRSWNKSPSQLGDELRTRALSAIERMNGTNDRRREVMTSLIERHDTPDGRLAHQALVTSSPTYLRAFNKAARGNMHLFSAEERDVVERAMSLTDAEGGYMVPFQLDPVVINTADGSFNQVRQVARQVVATGDVWNGISSAGVTWSVDAEAAEVSDDAPTLAQPTIPIYTIRGFVPISMEAFQDERNVAEEVGSMLAFGKDTLEATLLATGTGTAQPTGIVTALSGGASEVASITTDIYAIGDVYALDDALPARYRQRAAWLANRGIYNLTRQFDTGGGAGLWERLGADVPGLLLGRGAYEAEGMDGVITALADNYALIFGDFTNYVIADRIGMMVEFVPMLFATANNLPTGQKGWFASARLGADSVNDGAFRLLNVT